LPDLPPCACPDAVATPAKAECPVVGLSAAAVPVVGSALHDPARETPGADPVDVAVPPADAILTVASWAAAVADAASAFALVPRVVVASCAEAVTVATSAASVVETAGLCAVAVAVATSA
jgi:hypothetical protein